MEQSPRVEKWHGIALKTLLTLKQVTSNKDLLSVVIGKWMNSVCCCWLPTLNSNLKMQWGE